MHVTWGFFLNYMYLIRFQLHGIYLAFFQQLVRLVAQNEFYEICTYSILWHVLLCLQNVLLALILDNLF